MLNLRCFPAVFTGRLPSVELPRNSSTRIIVCAAKGPRPRYPRVWKSKRKVGTISKSLKLVERIKELSNVKEEVYGDLDSFIAWELEFPLITVKKALKTLEDEKEWKRIIQVTKWMLSKGQGRTMGSYYTLLNALAEDDRLEEAEELWNKLFSKNLEAMPRIFFEKMIKIYYRREMHDQIFEVFADMEELGIRPTVSVVSMVGDVFKKLDMLDKYEKLKRKYPPPQWEYRYIKGKRVKIRSKRSNASDSDSNEVEKISEKTDKNQSGLDENVESSSDEVDQIWSKHSNESDSDSNEVHKFREGTDKELSGLAENVEASSDVLKDEVDLHKVAEVSSVEPKESIDSPLVA